MYPFILLPDEGDRSFHRNIGFNSQVDHRLFGKKNQKLNEFEFDCNNVVSIA